MASMFRRGGSSSESLHNQFSDEDLPVMKHRTSDIHPSASSVHYVMVGYPTSNSPQTGDQDHSTPEQGTSVEEDSKLKQEVVDYADELDDDFSAVAEELCKVEAHSKLSTAVQRGFSGNVQNSVKKLGDTVAKACQQGDVENGGVSSDDGDSMFTAAYSLRKKLSSSRIAVEASDFLATPSDDVLSEYSASHDVDSVYVSPLSSKLMSTSGSMNNLLRPGKKSAESSQPESRVGELADGWHSVEERSGTTNSSAGQGVADWVAKEVPLDILMDSAAQGSLVCVQAQSPLAVSSSQTSDGQLGSQPTRRSSTGGESTVPVSCMEDADWDAFVDGVLSARKGTPRADLLWYGKNSVVASAGPQARKLVIQNWDSLTPDQRLMMKVEELELKVNCLLADRHAQRIPDGFVVLALPTFHYLTTLAFHSAHQMKIQLVRQLSAVWALRPLVPVINSVEDIAWAVFKRLPIVGLTEKQRY